MNILSRRNALIASVALLIGANVWFWTQSSKSSPPSSKTKDAPAAQAEEIAPSLAGLANLGRQWQQHIASLPPEARAASEAKLEKEKAFFIAAAQLPPAERQTKMREHFEELMNDPEIQALMLDQRIKRFARLSSAERQKLLKGYVAYKKQSTAR